MIGLIFNEETHTYTLDGRELPSVTQVLKLITAQAFAHVDPGVLARAAELGTAAHKMIELDCKGDLDEETLHEALIPSLQAWRSFLATSGFTIIANEQRVHSLRYAYAGTLDLFGMLNNRLCLIDAKRTASVPRSAGPQTAGYEIAFRETDLAKEYGVTPTTPIDRYALHLKAGGKWALVPFKNKNDSRVFLGALTCTQWLKEAA